VKDWNPLWILVGFIIGVTFVRNARRAENALESWAAMRHFDREWDEVQAEDDTGWWED